MNIYGIVHVLPKILYSEGLHMENFKSKFVTAEAAVAAAVKDGDWVDYGFGGGYPELLDKALKRCESSRRSRDPPAHRSR